VSPVLSNAAGSDAPVCHLHGDAVKKLRVVLTAADDGAAAQP